MSYKGLIVNKKQGFVIPEKYFRLALKNNPTVFGVGMAAPDDNGKLTLQLDHSDTPVEADKVLQALEALKDESVILYMGDFPQGFNKSCIQPFQILGTDKVPELIAFIEGDYSTFEQEKSNLSNEFHAAYTHLRPMLMKLLKANDGDIKKLMDEFQDPVLNRNILHMAVGRGIVSFLASTGEQHTIHGEGDITKFDWGWTTNSYGYSDQKEEPKKDGTLAKFGFGGSKKTPEVKSETIGDINKRRNEQEKVAAEKIVAKAEAKVEATADDEYEVVKLKCPKEIQGKNQIKYWYKTNCGEVPEDYKLKPEVEVRRKKAVAVVEPGPEKDTAIHNLPIPDKATKASVPEVKPEAKPEPKKVQDTKNELADKRPSPSRILSEDNRKAAEDRILKFLDKNSEEMIAPNAIRKIEEGIPSVLSQVGLNGMEDTFRWSDEMILDLAVNNPEFMANLFSELRSDYISLLSSTKHAEKKEEAKKSEIKPTASPAPAKHGTSALKRFGFGG